ncbi:MAG: hypothetical protein K6U12_12040 [Armatimonadetes bacterium]|nr:hypothetical protein [Armatimonadota bacterium]CUU36085.1 hypothetical protein DCOP10_116210 [Armatimonadetes bacterium DC]
MSDARRLIEFVSRHMQEHPYYAPQRRVLSEPSVSNFEAIPRALPESATLDTLHSMWRSHRYGVRRAALYGLISRFPDESITHQAVQEVLTTDPLLGNDALYWILSSRARPLIPLIADLLWSGRILDCDRSTVLEILLQMEYDFRPYEKRLLQWASTTPTFEDITPFVATAILLGLGAPSAKRLLDRLLNSQDLYLVELGLRVLGDYAITPQTIDALVGFVSRLRPDAEAIACLFRSIEILATVPLPEKVLNQLCRVLERWSQADRSGRFRKALDYFYRAYLSERGYPLGDGIFVRGSREPAAENRAYLLSYVQRLLDR